MSKLSGQLHLRPTRIGFLLRPSDMASLRRIMRLCTCLWGGTFNPIIPVCRTLPAKWRREPHIYLKGRDVTQGYIRFFEPDVYVEATHGLADECGIDRDTDLDSHDRVVALDNFVTEEDGRVPQFAFGLGIFDLYRDLYEKEYRFVPRDERNVILFEGRSIDVPFLEAVSGAFPHDENLSYLRQGYMDAFEPEIQEPNADNWLSAEHSAALSPLRFTRYGIDRHPDGSSDPRVFVADPKSPLDLLDLWNLRQFCGNVIPVNVRWFSAFRDTLREFIERTHRPLPGNPHGVMIGTVVEFGRSIDPHFAEEISKTILNDLPQRSWTRKMWYDEIWDTRLNDVMAQRERAQIEAKSQHLDIVLESEAEPVATLPSLSPEFAAPYGGHAARWANVVSLSDFVGRSEWALTLPSTPLTLMNSRLRRGRALIVSREGFVLPQRNKDHPQFLWFFRGTEAISEWLRERGIDASPSDSGRIADQVLASVDGFWGAHLLSDEETLKLLDKMSKSVRTFLEGERIEEYPDRTAHVSTWLDLVKSRNARELASQLDVQSFVKAGVLRLGLAITCSSCEYQNWYGIGQISERLVCERCRRHYDFPQGTLNFKNTPWRYRVTGPFSVPNYADGAYATVLVLRCLTIGLGFGRHPITYSSNLNLLVAGKNIEVDFACWYSRERMLGLSEEPYFVVGESKSFAIDAIGEVDVSRLKTIGKVLPGTVLVFSVLKEDLSDQEKKRIGRLALWGRETTSGGRWRAPVIVLTGTELFASHSVEDEWKERGGRRQTLTEPGYVRMDNLETLADLTQQVYLDLPAYGTWSRERIEKRRRRRKEKSRVGT